MAKRDDGGRFKPKRDERQMSTKERDNQMEQMRTRRAPSRDRDGEQGGNDPGMAPPIRLRDVRDGENLGDYSQSAGVGVSAMSKKVDLTDHGNANYQGPYKPMVGTEMYLEDGDEMDEDEVGQAGNKGRSQFRRPEETGHGR